MGMMHPCSGKHAYDYHWQSNGLEMSRDLLERAVKEEDRLRLDIKWQEKWACFDTNEWRLQVCHQLQLEALRAVGVAERELEPAVVTLRNHRVDYAEDASFYRPVYVRFDRAVGGTLCSCWRRHCQASGLPITRGDEGCTPGRRYSPLQDVPLIDPNTLNATTLLQVLATMQVPEPVEQAVAGDALGRFVGNPVVVLAGSIT